MKTYDIIGLLFFLLIFLTLIDRWYFRKIVIISREKIDSERFKINAITHILFNLIKVEFEYIEIDGKFYSVTKQSPRSDKKVVSTDYVQPRFVNDALLRYKLERGLND